MTEETPLNAVSIFSGGGGLDLGMEAVGFSVEFASDIDLSSCLTLEHNKQIAFGLRNGFLANTHIDHKSIEDLSADYILQKTGRKVGETHLLIGGPPCQSFSISGRRQGMNDPRGKLVYEYLRLLTELRPLAFVFENVVGFMTIENGAVFEEVTKLLANPDGDLSYTLSIHRLNASDYGVPQNRERIFLLGCQQDILIPEIPKFPTAKRTVANGLSGLPPISSEYPANHFGRRHGSSVMSRYDSLKPGQRDPKTRINKLDLSKPSFTIVVGSNNGGGKGHIHPIEPREVTPRESARLQTFPDWYEFVGTRVNDSIRQVGNAVPPLLAGLIGNEIRAEYFGLNRLSWSTIVNNLDQSHLFTPDELVRLSEKYSEILPNADT